VETSSELVVGKESVKRGTQAVQGPSRSGVARLRPVKPVDIRRQRALVTRRRILRAAYRLFCENGYVATTMDAIAAEAEVAVQTLYFTFHTKGALLGETLGAVIMGFDRWMGPPREPFDAARAPKTHFEWYPRFEAEPDARRALAIFVENSEETMRLGGALIKVLDAASGDPDAAAVYQVGERRRGDTYRTIVTTLARKAGLRPGLTVARATDILLVLFSGSTYHAMAAGRRWSPAECTRWFTDLLAQQLLPEED
jgi:AcrR family transcriptional regulator